MIETLKENWFHSLVTTVKKKTHLWTIRGSWATGNDKCLVVAHASDCWSEEGCKFKSYLFSAQSLWLWFICQISKCETSSVLCQAWHMHAVESHSFWQTEMRAEISFGQTHGEASGSCPYNMTRKIKQQNETVRLKSIHPGLLAPRSGQILETDVYVMKTYPWQSGSGEKQTWHRPDNTNGCPILVGIDSHS